MPQAPLARRQSLPTTKGERDEQGHGQQEGYEEEAAEDHEGKEAGQGGKEGLQEVDLFEAAAGVGSPSRLLLFM
jgi:hypothetical protein